MFSLNSANPYMRSTQPIYMCRFWLAFYLNSLFHVYFHKESWQIEQLAALCYMLSATSCPTSTYPPLVPLSKAIYPFRVHENVAAIWQVHTNFTSWVCLKCAPLCYVIPRRLGIHEYYVCVCMHIGTIAFCRHLNAVNIQHVFAISIPFMPLPRTPFYTFSITVKRVRGMKNLKIA